jgi:hypothetical protein
MKLPNYVNIAVRLPHQKFKNWGLTTPYFSFIVTQQPKSSTKNREPDEYVPNHASENNPPLKSVGAERVAAHGGAEWTGELRF